MQQSKHIMLDIETLGVHPGSAILTLGAVEFDLFFPSVSSGHEFYRRVDQADPIMQRFTVNPETKAWWKKQDLKAYHEAFIEEPRTKITVTLEEFCDWFWLIDQGHCLWSHGASFDIPIVEDAMRRLQVVIPWKYSMIRDTRTIYDLAGHNREHLGKPIHHALEDCKVQIKDVRQAYHSLMYQL